MQNFFRVSEKVLVSTLYLPPSNMAVLNSSMNLRKLSHVVHNSSLKTVIISFSNSILMAMIVGSNAAMARFILKHSITCLNRQGLSNHSAHIRALSRPERVM